MQLSSLLGLYCCEEFPPGPESGEVPEDADMEAADLRTADSEATRENATKNVESSEELADDAADEANEFIMAPRLHNVESPSDSATWSSRSPCRINRILGRSNEPI